MTFFEMMVYRGQVQNERNCPPILLDPTIYCCEKRRRHGTTSCYQRIGQIIKLSVPLDAELMRVGIHAA